MGSVSLEEDILSQDEQVRSHPGETRNGLRWSTAMVAGGWSVGVLVVRLGENATRSKHTLGYEYEELAERWLCPSGTAGKAQRQPVNVYWELSAQRDSGPWYGTRLGGRSFAMQLHTRGQAGWSQKKRLRSFHQHGSGARMQPWSWRCTAPDMHGRPTGGVSCGGFGVL